jgi:hypothetical protein
MHPSENPARQPSGDAVVVDDAGLPALSEAPRYAPRGVPGKAAR